MVRDVNTKGRDSRIFQQQSVPAILSSLASGGQVRFELGASYPRREYCVQYRESDFNFVCRLLEEEGIYFYFTHADGKHTMVLADGYGAHATTSGYDTIQFRDEETGRDPLEEAVTRLNPGGERAALRARS